MLKITTTEEKIVTQDKMSEAQTIASVEACHTARIDGRNPSPEARAKHMTTVAEKLREIKGELADLITSETGKPLKDGRTELDTFAAIFDCTAKNGPDALADEERPKAATASSAPTNNMP